MSKESKRLWYIANRERKLADTRRQRFKRLYGISVETYEFLLTSQEGACRICKELPTNGRRLCVDHSHSTGAVRGLLCVRCNSALERVEKEGWVDRAKIYLSLVHLPKEF